jgi:hypothetical protein
MTAFFLKGRTSRVLAVAVLYLMPLAVVPSGCKLFRRAPLQSLVNTRDPRTAGQLLSGFYGVEAAAWRWTWKQFAVKLKTPAGAEQKGGTLRLVFTLPPAVIESSGPVTVSGTLGGSTLAPETYSAPGAYTYQRDVPANLLASKEVTAQFQVDKTIRPGGMDRRELGLVATTISLESK